MNLKKWGNVEYNNQEQGKKRCARCTKSINLYGRFLF